jgi:hypothetical protein
MEPLPRRHPVGLSNPVPKQQLPETMARTTLILLRHEPSAHEIAQRLMLGVRDPDGREVTVSVTPREFLGVATVRLHAVSGLHRDQRGRDDFA